MLTTTKLIVPALTLLGIGAVPAHGQVFRISTTTDAFLPFFETGDGSSAFARGAIPIRGDDASFGFGGADLDPAGTRRGPIGFQFTADRDVQTGVWSNQILDISQINGPPIFLVGQEGPDGEIQAYGLVMSGRLASGLNFITLEGMRFVAILDGRTLAAGTGYLAFEQPIDPVNGGRANLLPFNTGFNTQLATDPTANIRDSDLLTSTLPSYGFYTSY